MIKKAIIPAAGYGTRGLPITKVLPKEMFPIGVKPAIHYVVEEAIESGIEEILMIVSRKKNMIIDYFDHSLELEAFLEKENKSHLLEKHKIPNVQIHYLRQPYAKGLGDAIRMGKVFIGDEPFAILLPDDLIIHESKPGLKQLIQEFERTSKSVIGLNTVADDQLKDYGVIKGKEVEPKFFELENIVEKPKNDPPSNHAVIGRYVFTPAIFSYLERQKPSVGGEVQLTDSIMELIVNETCFGKVIEGNRYDIGKTRDYIELVNRMNPID